MTNKSLDLVVVGELNIDLVLTDVPLPEYEKEKLAEDMRFTMGSSSAITAHNFSAIGGRVGFIGKVGTDNFGRFMVEELEKGEVETLAIIKDETLKTGATIVLADRGRKALLTYMGAMTRMTIDDIDWRYVSFARHLHLGCYYLQTGLRPDVPGLFQKAHSLGLTTSIDTNWDPEEKWSEEIFEVLKHTDIFLPNDSEAMQIARSTTVDDAVRKLGEVVRVVVVKCGKNGAIASIEGTIYNSPGISIDPVETTGAGDSFNAGFLYSYLREEELSTCLRYGNACGALAVTEIGGTGAFKEASAARRRIAQMLYGPEITT
jgi:sugar/nucleoside kinase (ribokinase family)